MIISKIILILESALHIIKENTFVLDVMASMEHMKMSATMKTATKLKD